MSFLEHLAELRRCLIRSMVAVMVGIVICWFFREELRAFLEAPLYDAWRQVPGLPAPSPLSFTSLMEPFVAYLKMASVGGIFLASPYLFYQLWKFISPGLYRRERRVAVPFVVISSILFVVGSAGAYTYVFPIGFTFFLQFSSGGKLDTHVARVTTPHSPRQETDTGNTDDTEMAATSRGRDAAKGAAAENGTSTQASSPDPSFPDAMNGMGGRIYRFFEDRIWKRHCATFSARTVSEGTTRLTYRYDLKKCGDAQLQLSVQRNGDPVPLSFVETESSTHRRYVAHDVVDRSGANQYTLHVTHLASRKLAPMLMVKDYLGFAVKLILAFGVVFEVPVLIFCLAVAGLVNARQLFSFGRWFIVLSVVFAAVLTPPDVVTQLLLAAPLVVLYYISVMLVFLMERRRGTNG